MAFFLSPAPSSYHHLESSLYASLLLLSRLKGKLHSTAEVRIRSLKASISLILHSAVQLKSHKLNDSELQQTAEEKVNESLKRLYQYLKEWVGSYAIIGLSFGYPLLGSAKRELEVYICDCIHSPLLCKSLLLSSFLLVDVGIHSSDRLSEGSGYRLAQYYPKDCL